MKHLSEEHKRKIGEANHKKLLGFKRSDEFKEKIRIAMIGRIHTWGDKISQGFSNMSEEAKTERARKIGLKHKGKIVSDIARKHISEAHKGVRLSEDAKKKIGLKSAGRRHTSESKKKIREYVLKTVLERKKNGIPVMPMVGKNETKILNELESLYEMKIIRQYSVAGYLLDGYIPELNLAIEIDEPHHYDNGILRKKDIVRQTEIENHLNCKFLRIKDTRTDTYDAS